jgi:hypothetical protein
MGKKTKEQQRHSNIRAYGISVAEYNRLFEDQNGLCAICGKDNGSISLCIDHDHKTNEVRGLLCNLCNRAIGLMKDDPILLIKAADYVKKGVPYYLKGKIEGSWRFGKFNRKRIWKGIVINEHPDLTLKQQAHLDRMIYE